MQQETKLPLVSIVISSLNNANELKFTVDSILFDSYGSIELVVIDGGSADGTFLLLESYANRIAHIVSEPDNGIYDAWNKGVRLATGDYIAFLGAGDCYVQNGLRQLVDCALANTEADFISSQVEMVSGGKVLRVTGHAWNWAVFRHYMNTTHVGSLHSRRLFEKYGDFDNSYRIAGDYEFLLRAGDSLRAAYLEQVIVRMEAGGASQSGYRVFSETERAKLKHQTVPPWVARLDTLIAQAKRFVRSHVLG